MQPKYNVSSQDGSLDAQMKFLQTITHCTLTVGFKDKMYCFVHCRNDYHKFATYFIHNMRKIIFISFVPLTICYQILYFDSGSCLKYGKSLKSSRSDDIKSDRISKRMEFLENLELNRNRQDDSAGVVFSTPQSIGEISRNELSRTTLALLILGLTILNWWKEKVSKVLPTKASENAIIDLPNGIKYQDLIVGNGKAPLIGDRLFIEFDLIYNGMVVITSKTLTGLGKAVEPASIIFASSPVVITPSIVAFPARAMMDGMVKMREGGRRRILVPPMLSFGEKGLPPLVPPSVPVIIEVSLLSIA